MVYLGCNLSLKCFFTMSMYVGFFFSRENEGLFIFIIF